MKAWLQIKGTAYHLRVLVNQREFQKSLGRVSAEAAQAALGTVCATIIKVRQGLLELPYDGSPIPFLLSGGSGHLVSRDIPDKIPLLATSELYLQEEAPESSATYVAAQRTHLKQLSARLGVDRDVRSITTSHLQEYLRELRMKKSAQTAIRVRNTLKKFFGWGRKQGYFVVSPAAGLPVIKDDTSPKPFRTAAQIDEAIRRGKLTDVAIKKAWKGSVFLAPKEIAELLELVRVNALDYRSYLLHAIAAYTGMRRGEILRLAWGDIDFEFSTVIARSHKQSRSRRETLRRIELHPELKSVLSEWSGKQESGNFVVGHQRENRQLTVHEANRLFWSPLRNSAWCLDSKRNWFKIGFHTYRHSFVSNLAASGVDQRVIREFVGHTSDQIQWRYLHLFPNQRQAAIRSFSLAPKGQVEADDKRSGISP